MNPLFILTIGLLAISVGATSWDDDDVILPSTTSKGYSQFSRIPDEEKRITPETSTNYVSLVNDHTNEDAHPSEGSVESTTPESSSSSESESSEVTPEGSKIRVVQLGKIPLTYEIIPLMNSEEKKHTPFFPEEETGRIETIESREPENSDVSEQHEIQAATDQRPRTPLTYMVPPRHDSEDYWGRYGTNEEVDNHPVIERLNDFLKTKRHSEEIPQEPEAYTTQDDVSVVATTEEVSGESSTSAPVEIPTPSSNLLPPQPFDTDFTQTRPIFRSSYYDTPYYPDTSLQLQPPTSYANYMRPPQPRVLRVPERTGYYDYSNYNTLPYYFQQPQTISDTFYDGSDLIRSGTSNPYFSMLMAYRQQQLQLQTLPFYNQGLYRYAPSYPYADYRYAGF